MKRESTSQSFAMRSRADNFPCEWSLAILSAPPPCLSFASSSRTSALSSRRRDVTSGARLRGVLAFAGGEPILDVVDQLSRRRTWPEQPADALCLERVHVFARNDAAAGDEDVVASLGFDELSHTWNERHVRATQNRQAYDVGVFLDRG